MSALKKPASTTHRPLPPESTTPACLSAGSISVVRRSIASPLPSAKPIMSIRSQSGRNAASTSSAITRMTVSIVPSLGFIMALYAVSAPWRSMLRSAVASILSSPSAARANPRNICDSITPELPRAPLSAPRATACIISPAMTKSRLVISRTAAFMVCDIFVPVSPSGTGKTFS